jgi:hypothetical protein
MAFIAEELTAGSNPLGKLLNKNAVAVMPKNQLSWYNSVIAGDFLVQNLETEFIHFWAG